MGPLGISYTSFVVRAWLSQNEADNSGWPIILGLDDSTLVPSPVAPSQK